MLNRATILFSSLGKGIESKEIGHELGDFWALPLLGKSWFAWITIQVVFCPFVSVTCLPDEKPGEQTRYLFRSPALVPSLHDYSG